MFSLTPGNHQGLLQAPQSRGQWYPQGVSRPPWTWACRLSPSQDSQHPPPRKASMVCYAWSALSGYIALFTSLTLLHVVARIFQLGSIGDVCCKNQFFGWLIPYSFFVILLPPPVVAKDVGWYTQSRLN